MKRDTGERRAASGIRHSVEQRRIMYRGREFHFVSYDGLPANEKMLRPATAPAWWLMGAGTRWEVLPFEPGLPAGELDLLFTQWIDAHIFATPSPGA